MCPIHRARDTNFRNFTDGQDLEQHGSSQSDHKSRAVLYGHIAPFDISIVIVPSFCACVSRAGYCITSRPRLLRHTPAVEAVLLMAMSAIMAAVATLAVQTGKPVCVIVL